MNAEHPTTTGAYPPPTTRTHDTITVFRRVSWAALFAGAVAALGIQLLLITLGAAVGLSMADVGRGGEGGGTTAAMVAGIYWLIVAAISLFVGGCVAARLSGSIKKADGMLHGFVTWSLTALFSMWAVTSGLGSILGGTASLAGNLAGAAPEAIEKYKSQDGGSMDRSQFWTDVRSDVKQIISDSGTPATGDQDAVAERSEIMLVAKRSFEPGKKSLSSQNREELIMVLQSDGDLPREEADNMVDDWESQWSQVSSQARTVADVDQQDMEQTKQHATQIADTAVDYSAGAMWWTFVGLLIGAAAGAIGGRVAAPMDPVL